MTSASLRWGPSKPDRDEVIAHGDGPGGDDVHHGLVLIGADPTGLEISTGVVVARPIGTGAGDSICDRRCHWLHLHHHSRAMIGSSALAVEIVKVKVETKSSKPAPQYLFQPTLRPCRLEVFLPRWIFRRKGLTGCLVSRFAEGDRIL